MNDPDLMTPFVNLLGKNKMALLLHVSEPVGHQYPGKGNVTPDAIYPFIKRFPNLNLVCAHWGGGLPFYALMPEVKNALENVYFDTAASPFLYNPQVYAYVSGLVGADRILMGSDYPLMPPNRLINEIRSLDLPEEDRGLILSGNANRLLRLNN